MPYVAAIQLVIFILCVYSYFVLLTKAVVSRDDENGSCTPPYNVSVVGISALFMAVALQSLNQYSSMFQSHGIESW